MSRGAIVTLYVAICAFLEPMYYECLQGQCGVVEDGEHPCNVAVPAFTYSHNVTVPECRYIIRSSHVFVSNFMECCCRTGLSLRPRPSFIETALCTTSIDATSLYHCIILFVTRISLTEQSYEIERFNHL